MKHIFLETMQRIKDKIPEVKWIDQDLGQLEFYTERPPVLFPCVLIDFDDSTFSDMGQHAQMCNCTLKLRVAFNVVQHSNGVTPQPQLQKALEIFDVMKKLHQYLHGWSGTNFGELTRIRQTAEPREDNLRVYVIQYSVNYEEYIDDDDTQTIPTPLPSFTSGGDNIFSDEYKTPTFS